MNGRFLQGLSEAFLGDIYADKSSIVIDWLLRVGIEKERFCFQEIAKDRGVSTGLIHKVVDALVLHGLLEIERIATAKCFSLKRPKALLQRWLEQYNIVKKCKMWIYRSGFQEREELLKVLKSLEFSSKTALALHSAAEAYRCKNSNLNTLEIYMLDPNIKTKLEQTLKLEPQERGYEVLLIKPYYKSLLKLEMDTHEGIGVASPLLTYLDLYHFPLLGPEQAQFMAERIPELKSIYKKG